MSKLSPGRPAGAKSHDPEIAKALGQIVLEQRRNRNKSQMDLAEDGSLERAQLSKIERGIVVPSLGVIERLATALGLSLTELIRKFEVQLKKDRAEKKGSPPTHRR
ncbi:MAG: transcriptional regulator [Variovorax paradoxus]|nr:MAG: transcriptional regulator [Variovorax paradoxus]PZQ04753.1 MAG: transcriptional regulator [Variovorax paradoxus]